ncbi:MAG: sulfatase-like hydrolase/transferase [Chlamydiia bacterium]
MSVPIERPWKAFRVIDLYYTVLFLALTAIHGHSILVASTWALTTPWPFWMHVGVQCGVEVLALGWVANWIYQKRQMGWLAVWMTFSFVLLVLHFIDFHLVRVMDLSFWYMGGCVVGETWENFVEILYSSDVSPLTYLATGIGFLVALGIFFSTFYWALWSLAPREGGIRGRWSLLRIGSLAVGCVGLFLITVDGFWTTNLSHDSYDRYARALPWKRTLLEPSAALTLSMHLKRWDWEHAQKGLNGDATQLATRPDLFLFVVESLRHAAIRPDTAPHLCQFREDYYGSHASFANANATPLSWFAIFTGLQPSRWGDPENALQESPPLHILKKAGYQVHLLSSSRLSYYRLDEQLFGLSSGLTDSVYLELSGSQPVWKRDRAVMERLMADVESRRHEGGHCYVVFLEGTHFNYSWPAEETLFTPVPDSVDFVQAAWGQENMEGIKRRYYNAIHYMDSLMGQFFNTLRRSDELDQSMIVFTSDHGEEFLEHGHLFHASALTDEQISVPIYYKLPSHNAQALPSRNRITSHVDIFPTVLHSLYGDCRFATLFDGESLLAEAKHPFAISWRYNASRTPHEFVVHDQEAVLAGKLDWAYAPLQSQTVSVTSLQDAISHQPIPIRALELEQKFRLMWHHYFDPSLDHAAVASQ